MRKAWKKIVSAGLALCLAGTGLAISGSAETENKTAYASLGEIGALAFDNSYTEGDFELSFDAKTEKDVDNGSTFSVDFLWTNDSNTLILELYRGREVSILCKPDINNTNRLFNAWQSGMSEKIQDFSFQDWHTYTINVTANVLTLSVDDVVFLENQSTASLTGTGMRIRNGGKSDVFLDNIKLTGNGKSYTEDFEDGSWGGMGRDVAETEYTVVAAADETDTTAPVFAPDTQVTARTSDSLTLSWTAASDDTTAADALLYRVYVSETDFSGQIPQSAPALTLTGVTTDTAGGLKAETEYYIAIAVQDEAGNESYWFSQDTVSTMAANATTGDLVITADVGVEYTLSIPTSMGIITDAGDHKAGTLYATKLILDDGGKLTVTAENKAALTKTGDAERTLAYALQSTAFGGTELAAYAPVEFDGNSTTGEEGGTDLYVSIAEADWAAAAAGTYTDTVTFSVAYTAG